MRYWLIPILIIPLLAMPWWDLGERQFRPGYHIHPSYPSQEFPFIPDERDLVRG